MSARWVRSFLVVLVLCAFGLSSAQAAKTKSKSKTKATPPPAVVETDDAAFPPAELTVGFQVRDSETEGIGDLLLPLWNPGGTGLLFVNPRTAVVDHDETEGNLGLGYRQLLPKLSLILGANLYYDYRDTETLHYDQWGFGLELLSPWIDARANYYDPDDKRSVIASETQTAVSQSVRTTSDWNDPYAENHYILQDYVTTRTLTTTTTTKTFEQYEQALGGYDWELGLRLPIKSDALEARVFGGYYDFDRDFGDDARGWKTRAEVRVRSSLFLDAGLYENDELTGSDWFAGARWTAPLDLGKLARGRNPFATAKARLRGESRPVGARLTEMVMRDPQIRLERSKMLENPALTTEQITRQVDRDRDPYLLLPDVQFVDGDADAAGNGSAEAPFTTIQQAANAVYGTRNVYVYNASAPYEENVVLQDGTTLWGSGVLIAGYGGEFFGTGIAPIVDGMDRGPTITMVDNTAIQGFQIQNTYQGLAPVLYEGPIAGTPLIRDVSRVGILGDDAAHLIIQNNLIVDNETGVYVERQGDLDLLFAHNVVANNSDPHDYGGDGLDRSASGLEIYAQGSSGTFDVSIVDSLFGGNAAFGAMIDAGTYDASVVDVQDSAFLQNAFSGLALVQWDTADAQALLQNVQTDENGTGLFIGAAGAGTTLVALQNVSASGNVGFGVGVAQTDFDTAQATIADSTAAGNGADGFLLSQTAGDSALAEISGSTANDNAGTGILVLQAENAIAQVDVVGSAAADNVESGFELTQIQNSLATIRVADSQASGNEAAGLLAVQGEADLAVAAIRGLQADENAVGILLQQMGVGIALANVSGSCADRNTQFGIEVWQDSDLASLAILGMPDGLATSVDGIADLLGLALPEEIAPFLAPSGGVSASDNGIGGIRSIVSSDGLIALNGLFDVTANDNVLGDGAFAMTMAPNGIGVGLAGSSENWADIFQLGAQIGDLFDVDLPLALAGDGHFQANGNGSCGLIQATMGEMAAVNATFGVEASGNGTVGLLQVADSAFLSLNAVGRLEALDNGNLGLFQNTYAQDFAAVSLLADVNASGNGTDPLVDGGILTETISDNGAAIMLGLSTDALRPLAAYLGEEFLGEAFELPGEPFGPVIASGNNGFGISAIVDGDSLAAAALLDVQANDNAADGIDLFLESADGPTVSLLASTDLLYDVLPEALGADPIAGAGLGPVTASGNGGSGLVIEQNGAGSAITLLAGVEANNNLAGDGILATLNSDFSSAGAFLVDVEADGNAAGRGIDLDLTGSDDVLAGLVFVDADDNGQQGIRITGNSVNEDAYALLGGIDTDRNGALGNQAGIVVDLTAGGDASAALTDVYARYNTGRGANILLNAGGDANLFAGDFAADDLDAIYGFSGDLGPLFGLIPTGNDVFSDNGSGGLHAELTSANGNALVGISGANADYNGNAGFNLELNALNGNALVGIEWAYANENDGNGINLSLNGGGGIADVLLNRVGANGNGANGIQISDNYNGTVGMLGAYLSATSNDGNGVRLALSGLGGVPNLDFGGGGDSLGQSSFYANGNRDFRYNNGGGGTVMAENNFWGADLDPVANGQTAGSIDADPWLPAAP